MYEFAPGSTSQSVQMFLRDSLTGQPKLGLTHLSSGAQAGYSRQGGTSVGFTLANLAAPDSVYAVGGFKEMDAALTPGVYRVDVPDAGLGAGAGFVTVTLNFDGTLGEGVLILLRNSTNNVGPGAYTHTVTVQTSLSAPIPGASLWVSTDSAGSNVIAGALTTNALGQVAFMLSAGTYYLWIVASGYTVSNPATFTVSGNGAQTQTLAAAAAPPSLTGSTVHQDRITAQDLADRLFDFTGADAKEDNYRSVRRAILDAVREFSSLHKWTYLKSFGRLNLKASYSTGTVALDVTGGAFENQLTLTDGTWPTWAASGYVRIGNAIAKVDRRISSSVITLKSPTFSDDVTAGTAFSIYKDTYTLPANFVSSDNVMVETSWGMLNYVSPAAYLERVRHDLSVGTPCWWTLIGDPDLPGRLALAVWPAPDADGSADFLYSRKIREVRNFDVTTGTATVTGGSPTTITLSSPVLKSDMVGSTIRLSASSGDAPTGLDGLNPYVYEGTILRVQSTTVMDVDADAPVSTATAYRISDPIDLEDSAFNALARAAEKHLAFSRIMKSRLDSHKAWLDALVLAKEADSRVDSSRRSSVGGTRRRSLADMPIDFSA